MHVDTMLGEQIARYVDLAAAQAKLSAANMANVDTPGYRARGLDFDAEMRRAIGESAAGGAPRAPQIGFEDGLVARPDGNNVSVDREGLTLAEAQLRYRTGVTLLKQQYQVILDAIHADGGK